MRLPIRKPSLIGYADRPLSRAVATPPGMGLPLDEGGWWWRGDAYRIAAFDGGADLLPGLAADLVRRRYALPMGMSPAEILAATPAEIAAAMMPCAFSDVFTFTRASTGTYVSDDGSVQTAGIDQTRFGPNGLLLEGSSTNFWVQSQRGTNPASIFSSVSRVVVQPSNLIAPDGTTSATEYTTTGETDPLLLRDFSGDPSGRTFTFSFDIYQGANPSGLTPSVRVFSYGSPSPVNPSSTDYVVTAQGWNRITYTRTFPAAMGVSQFTFRVDPGDGSGGGSNTPPAGFSQHLWGCQLEEAPRASSYMRTNGSAVTRAADICLLTPRAAALIKRTAFGTLLQGKGQWGAFGRFLGGSSSTRIIGLNGDQNVVAIGSTLSFGVSPILTVPLPDFGIAAGFDAIGKRGSYNGNAAVGEDIPLDASLETIFLGRASTGSHANGHYKQLVAWPARPANAALPGKAVPHA